MKITLKMLCSITKIRPSLNRISIQYIGTFLAMGVSNLRRLQVVGNCHGLQVNCHGWKMLQVNCDCVGCSKKVVCKVHCCSKVRFISSFGCLRSILCLSKVLNLNLTRPSYARPSYRYALVLRNKKFMFWVRRHFAGSTGI